MALLAAPCWNALEASDDTDEDAACEEEAAGGPVHTALVEDFGNTMFEGLLGHSEQ